MTLETRASSADIFTKRGDVGSVGTHASSIYGESEQLSLLDAQAGIVELGEAIAFGGYEAIEHGSIQRPWWATLGGSLVDDVEELSPVSTVPHFAPLFPWADLHAIGCKKTVLGSMKQDALLSALPEEERR
jgi:hypothetical protein